MTLMMQHHRKRPVTAILAVLVAAQNILRHCHPYAVARGKQECGLGQVEHDLFLVQLKQDFPALFGCIPGSGVERNLVCNPVPEIRVCKVT
eukprot:1979354-Rhodomonas_salina.3